MPRSCLRAVFNNTARLFPVQWELLANKTRRSGPECQPSPAPPRYADCKIPAKDCVQRVGVKQENRFDFILTGRVNSKVKMTSCNVVRRLFA